jgi:hypothetical protein
MLHQVTINATQKRRSRKANFKANFTATSLTPVNLTLASLTLARLTATSLTLASLMQASLTSTSLAPRMRRDLANRKTSSPGSGIRKSLPSPEIRGVSGVPPGNRHLERNRRKNFATDRPDDNGKQLAIARPDTRFT